MSNFGRSVSRFIKTLNRNEVYGHEPKLESEDMLVGALLREFIQSATFSAAVACLAIAKSHSRHVEVIGSISGYFPADPLIFPAVTAGMIAPSDHAGLVESLHNYYLKLSFARSITNVPEGYRKLGENSGSIIWAHIADVWCRACASALLVVHHSHDTNFTGDSGNNQQINTLHQLLVSVGNGGSPCVRADGRFFVPGWLDQRRQERKPIGCKVWVEAEGVRVRAILQDISPGGMGIASCPAIPVGARVSAQLADDRVLTGIVTWSKGQRLGARLTQPLSPTDPLLAPDRDHQINTATDNFRQ